MKDQIKSRLLNGEKFEAPRGSGKTQAIIELLFEHDSRFVAVVPTDLIARLLVYRYQKYCYEKTDTPTSLAVAQFKIRTLHGNQAFPVGYHDYIGDEIYRFPKIPFFLFAGVGTTLENGNWIYSPEPSVVLTNVSTEEEEFAWHFEPRP